MITNELEMFNKWMIFTSDFASYLCGIVPGFFVMEEVTVLQINMANSLKTPEEIKVPVAPTKFTISDSLQASRFFFLN